MVSDDLVKRLRAGTGGGKLWMDLHEEAADRIEALQAQLADLDKACAEWAEVSQRNYQRAKAAEAQLAKAREDALREAAEAAYQWWDDDDAQELRDHIRALLDTPTPAPAPD